jgi:hypothetical protein
VVAEPEATITTLVLAVVLEGIEAQLLVKVLVVVVLLSQHLPQS